MGPDWEDLVDALRVLNEAQGRNPDNAPVREAIGSISLTIAKMARLHETAMAKDE